MLDDMLDHLEGLRQNPVWREPQSNSFGAENLPAAPSELQEVHRVFLQQILPFGSGNLHPGFMGWAQGAGTAVGALAEMMAAGLNANVGGRQHAAVLVERNIAVWMRDLFGLPQTAHGLFMTGTSQANFVAVILARNRMLGRAVRAAGIAPTSRLVAYASSQVHGCLARAMDLAGLGSNQLRLIDVDEDYRMDAKVLRATLAADRDAGYLPFLVVATAGSVNVGSIDDLASIAEIARSEDLTFHVDGAIGAPLAMSKRLKPLLDGIARCDSLAFDFHKWTHVPYDAGFLIVRDGAALRQSFASDETYLTRAKRGLAAGEWWPCDYGPDLSRSFRALKTWYTLMTYGTDALAAEIEKNCALAQALAQMIDDHPDLERMAPVTLNIVCFRFRHEASDRLNEQLVEMLHVAGEVAPSLTVLDGQVVIRAAIFNHRTEMNDVRLLVDRVVAVGKDIANRMKKEPIDE